jgi:hypothetical protein
MLAQASLWSFGVVVAAPAPIFSFGNTSVRDHGRSFPSQEKNIRHARTEDAHANVGCRAPIRDRTREGKATLGNLVAIRDRTREGKATLGNLVALSDKIAEGTAILGNLVALSDKIAEGTAILGNLVALRPFYWAHANCEKVSSSDQ